MSAPPVTKPYGNTGKKSNRRADGKDDTGKHALMKTVLKTDAAVSPKAWSKVVSQTDIYAKRTVDG
jgi:hypothetical protein